MDFDFYYGLQAQTFSFYRIPKLLFTDSRFSSLSAEAKTLYGILLDRMDLSMKNGWLDKQNRVYLFFTVQEIQESLGCGKKKGCMLDSCYYQRKPENVNSECYGCPYGRAQPCIGWCTRKILRNK